MCGKSLLNGSNWNEKWKNETKKNQQQQQRNQCRKIFNGASIVCMHQTVDTTADDLEMQYVHLNKSETEMRLNAVKIEDHRWYRRRCVCVSVVKVNTLHLRFSCAHPFCLRLCAQLIVLIFNFIILNGTISFCSFSRAEKVFVARFKTFTNAMHWTRAIHAF